MATWQPEVAHAWYELFINKHVFGIQQQNGTNVDAVRE